MVYSFLRVTVYQKTLMTNARQDRAIRTPNMWGFLHEALSHTSGVQILSDSPRGASRPGEVMLTWRNEPIRVRYPSYLAGHMVPERAAAELYEDIVAFWND